MIGPQLCAQRQLIDKEPDQFFCLRAVAVGDVCADRNDRLSRQVIQDGCESGEHLSEAEAGVSIFAVSTFDTDYVLLKEADLTTTVPA